jgi:alternate signal-mediated exported protein
MKKKYIIILLLILSTSVISVASYAYYSYQNNIQNNFNVTEYNIELKEYFPKTEWDEDNLLEKRVTITNSGKSDVLLRISYNEKWSIMVNDEERILNNLANNQPIVDKNWNQEFLDDFILHDGWYYYKKVLEVNSTVNILDTIEKNSLYYNDDEVYQLDFNYEVLQCNENAAEEVWGHDITINNKNVNWNF